MADKQPYTSTLNNLIEACKDGEEGFRQAAQAVQSSDLRELFDEYARQRAQFAAELQREVSKTGDEPEQSGSVGGSLHRGWMNIKTAVTGKDEQPILDEAERGEDAAVKAYKEALSKGLPAEIQLIVNRQFQEVQQAHNRVRALRDQHRELAGARK